MRRYDRGPETERLVLRAATPADAEAVFAFNTHPEVMRYTGEPMPRSVKDVRDMLAAYPDFERHGYGRWLCVEKKSSRVIGFAGLKVLEELGEVDLGYRLLPEFWGRGLATEAASACVGFGLDGLRLKSIIGLVLPENLASIRVLEKVGMTFDGATSYGGDPCLRYRITARSDRHRC